jgi:hypothetical protein
LARTNLCVCSCKAGLVLGDGMMPCSTSTVIGRRTISFTFNAGKKTDKNVKTH